MKPFTVSILNTPSGPDWGYLSPNQNVLLAKSVKNKGATTTSECTFALVHCKPIRVATPPNAFRASKSETPTT